MIKLLQDIFKTQSSLSCVLAPDHDPRRFCPLKEKLRKNVSSALLWFLLLQACWTSLVVESKAGQELEGAHFCCQTNFTLTQNTYYQSIAVFPFPSGSCAEAPHMAAQGASILNWFYTSVFNQFGIYRGMWMKD